MPVLYSKFYDIFFTVCDHSIVSFLVEFWPFYEYYTLIEGQY